jgi:signal transduction histidine kinase
MAADVAHVALHDDRETIVRAALLAAKEVAEADSAFAAVRNEVDDGYDIGELDGISDPGFSQLTIRSGRGLGGAVLAERRPRTVDDYATEPSITGDYREVVGREGLHGIGCVPVLGPDGTEVLLYVSTHATGGPSDVAVEALEDVASAAAIGLHHAAARARERELAALRERQALASELHDSVAQALFAIGIAAQHSRESRDQSVIEEKLSEIESAAAAARSDLREALARLSRTPDAMRFEAVFEGELRLFEHRTGRHVWITRHGEPRELARASEQLLIDSVREGLRNAAKHAYGPVVLAHLGYTQTGVLLSLQTEFSGGRPRVEIAPGSGLGMLRERTERLGGELELALADDDVAVLRVEVPA